MDTSAIIPVLSMLTLLIFVVWSFISQQKLEKRRDDPDATKSTLASDKADDGKPADT